MKTNICPRELIKYGHAEELEHWVQTGEVDMDILYRRAQLRRKIKKTEVKKK